VTVGRDVVAAEVGVTLRDALARLRWQRQRGGQAEVTGEISGRF
jgi:hypothetical protein